MTPADAVTATLVAKTVDDGLDVMFDWVDSKCWDMDWPAIDDYLATLWDALNAVESTFDRECLAVGALTITLCIKNFLIERPGFYHATIATFGSDGLETFA